MPNAACEHAHVISTSGRAFLHSWDSIWGLEQCNSTRCLPGVWHWKCSSLVPDLRQTLPIFVSYVPAGGEMRGLQRYYEDLLAGYAKCRRHFLQGVLRMSAHLLFDKFSPALYIDKFCVRSFFFLIQKTWKISNKETREEILQFNKQTKHENLCYFMVGLLCDVIQIPAYVLEYILFSRNSPRAC